MDPADPIIPKATLLYLVSAAMSPVICQPESTPLRWNQPAGEPFAPPGPADFTRAAEVANSLRRENVEFIATAAIVRPPELAPITAADFEVAYHGFDLGNPTAARRTFNPALVHPTALAVQAVLVLGPQDSRGEGYRFLETLCAQVTLAARVRAQAGELFTGGRQVLPRWEEVFPTYPQQKSAAANYALDPSIPAVSEVGKIL